MEQDDPNPGQGLVPLNRASGQDAPTLYASSVPKIKDHSAHGAIGGFLHQIQWALVVLLRAGREDPNAYVKLEHLDDIEIVRRDDGTVLIQVKSSITGRPPEITNTSRDLWSTLHVWADYVRTNPLTSTRERFILVTTAHCASGSAAEAIKLRDRHRALDIINSVASTDTGTTNASAYAAWQTLTDSQRLRIVNAIDIADDTVTVSQISEVISRELHPSMPGDPRVEQLRDSILGWWTRRIASHIQNRSMDAIYYEDLVRAVQSRVDQLSISALPIDGAILDYVHQLEAADETKTYVQQLRLIAAADAIIIQAIADYFRAKSHIDKWLREDLFPPEKLHNYYSELRDRWKRRAAMRFSQISAEANEDELQEAGRSLYGDVSSQRCDISTDRTEEWIMMGSYHDLSDQKKVGWHRDFEDRLK